MSRHPKRDYEQTMYWCWCGYHGVVVETQTDAADADPYKSVALEFWDRASEAGPTGMWARLKRAWRMLRGGVAELGDCVCWNNCGDPWGEPKQLRELGEHLCALADWLEEDSPEGAE